ncbi:MAG: LacI family DNA-binding transcriptional regulator [Bauldia sp.]|nr:MAG: LacI family DNA-binding transcriptional regulator [Bauldia sp.]
MTDRDQPKETRHRRTTLSDVAERAGVSQVTASRVMRRPEMVSAELRRRVETAMRDLAYVPNQLASALASARTHTIGAVVPSLTNGVFSDYLRALHDIFLPSGLQVLVLNSRYSAEEEEKAVVTLLGHHPEAMIVVGVDQTARTRMLLEQSGVPVVQTMELADAPIDINIGLSQRDAAFAATRYLLGCGYRRIANMTAPLDARARRRLEGFRGACRESGVADEMVATAPRQSSVKLGVALFTELIDRWPDVDAVFCGNDNLALGSLFECQRRGIRVPDDIAIMGFTDIEFCAAAYPSITSVATPRYEMARRSAEIILEIIRGSGERPAETRIDLGFSIVERDSTRRSRADAGPLELIAGE